MKLNQINSSAIITGRCPNHLGGVVAPALCAVVLLVGFVLLGGIQAEAQKPDPWSLRPDNQIGGPAGGLPRPPSFHNPVRNRTWCEIQKEGWGAVGTGILNTGHFLADVGYGVIQVAVANTTGYYLPNPNNPSGFFEMTQGDALRALVEGPLIAVDDIFTGDGLKACEAAGGALVFAPIGGMLRRGKCGEAPKPGAPLSDNALQSFVTYAKPESIPGFESTSIIFGGPGPVSTIFQLPNPSGYSGYLAGRIPGLSTAQADFLLERAGQSSVCVGGSRIRGDFWAGSDLDVGFGCLSVNQANRIINACNARVDTGNFPLRLDRTPIVPGFSPKSGAFSTILSPEEFFGRCGIRSCTDGRKAGQPFSPSGSITYDPNFGIIILYP